MWVISVVQGGPVLSLQDILKVRYLESGDISSVNSSGFCVFLWFCIDIQIDQDGEVIRYGILQDMEAGTL